MAEDSPDRLRPCPSSPNCVSSQADEDDSQHHIAPLALRGEGVDAARQHLKRIVAGMPRSEVVDEGERYLHATFKTRLLGFVDDVEFLLCPEDGVVHMRSASRKGWSDLGVNRRRLETLRKRWNVD